VIDLYTWATPNGRKLSIMLEECGLEYNVHPVNISKGEQFEPDFLKISPNNKIPAIVDNDNNSLSIFESGAILVYLAEKTGKLVPAEEPARSQTMAWLMFQVGGLGPMLGQFVFFTKYADEKIPFAIKRYETEAYRILGVVEKALSENEYLAGEYSIADISTYPWLNAAFKMMGLDSSKYPKTMEWLKKVGSRPAVQKGMTIPEV